MILQDIKWGIIGCGDVTEIKSGPAFNKIDNSKLVAVMRRDADKAKDYATRHNVPKWYNNADELINDPDINMVYVATPPNAHAEYAIKALQAGKAVYCEKPMALNYLECLKMMKTSQELNVPLFVAYYRRSLEEFVKVKQLIDIQKIGEVRFVNIKLYQPPKPDDSSKDKAWRISPEISGGGYFVDLAPHQLDVLQYYFGKIETVHSIVSNQAKMYRAEDMISASFQFENGVVGTGTWCFSVDQASKLDEIEIVGTKGTLYFSAFDHIPIEVVTKHGAEIFEFNRPQHIQQPFIQSIVNAMTGKGTTPADLKMAAHTSLIIDKILEPYHAK